MTARNPENMKSQSVGKIDTPTLSIFIRKNHHLWTFCWSIGSHTLLPASEALSSHRREQHSRTVQKRELKQSDFSLAQCQISFCFNSHRVWCPACSCALTPSFWKDEKCIRFQWLCSVLAIHKKVNTLCPWWQWWCWQWYWRHLRFRTLAGGKLTAQATFWSVTPPVLARPTHVTVVFYS